MNNPLEESAKRNDQPAENVKVSACLPGKKGLTLIELLVSLTIFLLVLGLGYNVYFYINKSYSSTENRWVKQRAVQRVASFISTELKNASSVSVANTEPATGIKKEYDLYLSGGRVLFRDGTAEPQIIAEGGLNLQFDKAKKDDGSEAANMLAFSVSAPDIGYTVNSQVLISNIPETQSVNVPAAGSAVHFKTTSDIASVPSMQFDVCFIATAAYGTNAEPSVLLLRDFRDRVLLKFPLGRRFIDLYYRNSPPIARTISGNGLLRCVVMILLTPLIGIVEIIMYKEALLLLMLFIVTLFYYSRRRDQALSPYGFMQRHSR